MTLQIHELYVDVDDIMLFSQTNKRDINDILKIYNDYDNALG